jgi:elongation factor P
VIIASQLREGMAVRIDGHVYKVLESENKAGAGQAGGVTKTKLRDVISGRQWEPHFRPDERLEDLELQRQPMDFLYEDAGNLVFMNPDTYDQVEVPRGVLGNSVRFLKEGMRMPVEFFDDRPISLEFPPVVELVVADTAAPMHSGQDSTWKDAILENGVPVQVPLFIGHGELIRIDTRTGKYLERVRIERKKGA